jgi:hypothetical protein
MLSQGAPNWWQLTPWLLTPFGVETHDGVPANELEKTAARLARHPGSGSRVVSGPPNDGSVFLNCTDKTTTISILAFELPSLG